MSPSVFPQDEATGISETVDWDDAGGFAQLAYRQNSINYVEEGFDFTPDYTNNVLNISSGVAIVTQPTVQTGDHQEDGGPGPKVLRLAAFIAQGDASGDLALTDAAVNHVYLAVDQNTNDAIYYRVNTDQTVPEPPSLKLGTVNTTTDTYSYENRNPVGTFSRIEVRAPPTDQ